MAERYFEIGHLGAVLHREEQQQVRGTYDTRRTRNWRRLVKSEIYSNLKCKTVPIACDDAEILPVDPSQVGTASTDVAEFQHSRVPFCETCCNLYAYLYLDF